MFDIGRSDTPFHNQASPPGAGLRSGRREHQVLGCDERVEHGLYRDDAVDHDDDLDHADRQRQFARTTAG